jgi:hypothetical protein
MLIELADTSRVMFSGASALALIAVQLDPDPEVKVDFRLHSYDAAIVVQVLSGDLTDGHALAARLGFGADAYEWHLSTDRERCRHHWNGSVNDHPVRIVMSIGIHQ